MLNSVWGAIDGPCLRKLRSAVVCLGGERLRRLADDSTGHLRIGRTKARRVVASLTRSQTHVACTPRHEGAVAELRFGGGVRALLPVGAPETEAEAFWSTLTEDENGMAIAAPVSCMSVAATAGAGCGGHRDTFGNRRRERTGLVPAAAHRPFVQAGMDGCTERDERIGGRIPTKSPGGAIRADSNQAEVCGWVASPTIFKLTLTRCDVGLFAGWQASDRDDVGERA